MSQSISLTASPPLGRNKAQQQQQQQQQQQHRQPLLQQQQLQLQRYRDRSTANRNEGDGEIPQQHPQRQRSRRPRSIHITLRKTRAGSRPVNIQRSQNHFFTASGERVGSPTVQNGGVSSAASASAGAGESGEKNGVDAYALVDDETPPRMSPTDVVGRNSRAGSASGDAAGGPHARVHSGSGVLNGGGGNGSSSSSFNGFVSGGGGGGGGGSNASVGPSSGSGCAPSLQSVPQLNTFMKAPHATLQQLLPPGMRDRVNSNNTNNNNNNYNCNNNINIYRSNAEVSPTAPVDVLTPSHLQQHGNSHRLRSRSQLYISSSTMGPVMDAGAASGGGGAAGAAASSTAALMTNAGRLRSNSSAAQFDGLTGSYSGVLGDFVFPHPDRSTPLCQPRTPPAAAASNIPNVSLESRSPRLSPPAMDQNNNPNNNAGSLTGGSLQQEQQHQQQQQHTRARSYTAGGSYYHHHSHRSSNGPVITASMAGAGGAALFYGHGRTPSMSHAESYTSRNLDRSLSLSSSPAGFGVVNGTPAPPNITTASTTSTMAAHPTDNTATSRSSLRSAGGGNLTHDTTPVTGSPAAQLHGLPVCATPPSTPQQQQQQQQQQAMVTPNPQKMLQTQQHPQQQRPTLTPSAAGTPTHLGRSTRKSESFVARRSTSSDMVNGLDDSVDSVLCGSTPRRLSTHGPSGTHRYVMDSMTSDSGVLLGGAGGATNINNNNNNPISYNSPTSAESRRARRYSMTLTDEEEGAAGTNNNTNNNNAPPMSTLDRLRSRRDAGNTNGNGGASSRPLPGGGGGHARRDHIDATSEPKTAIERWRAMEEQKRRDEALQARRHRLSARQWREAFRRLEENRVKWTMRSFIGAGTSGKVYEGVLEDAARTPVAVKVLDVGVPMPVGPGTTAPGEDNNMSPAQQEALLVLLREVEMMEKLHQENIVTCLRCQVTPVHDRFMELHRQQRHSQMRPSGDGKNNNNHHNNNNNSSPSRWADEDNNYGGGNNTNNNTHDSSAAPSANVSPQRVSAVATRIPVQVEIIMELCKRGTLASVVRRSPGGQLPVVTARRYLRDVLKGLAYLHRNNFIHRDVKGENVLISADDVAKLADFGCSRRIVMTNSHIPGDGHDATMSSIGTTHATDSRYTTMADYQWCEATGVAQTMVGTPMFMAPEIIQASGAPPQSPCSVDSMERGERGGGEAKNRNNNGSFAAAAAAPVGYTASADIWSFGCLVLEVFGRTPWPTAGNNVYHLMKQIEQSVDDLPPGVPQDTPAELLNVLRCCFMRDPHRRSTARGLLRTPWMTCKDEELEEMPPRRRR